MKRLLTPRPKQLASPAASRCRSLSDGDAFLHDYAILASWHLTFSRIFTADFPPTITWECISSSFPLLSSLIKISTSFLCSPTLDFVDLLTVFLLLFEEVFTYLFRRHREREGARSPLCWFTPHMATTARIVSGRS